MTLTNNGPREAEYHLAELEALKPKILEYDLMVLDEISAAELNDLIKKIQGKGKAAETDRKALKEPSLLEGRQIDASFKPVSAKASELIKDAKSFLTPYLLEQKRIADEAREKAAKEAAEKLRIAEQLKQDALVGDMVKEDADKAIADLTLADAVAESAGRAGSASGMSRTASLRTYYDAYVTDALEAAKHYADHPKMTDLIISLAGADMRSDKTKTLTIPGVSFNQRQEVA